MRVCGGVHCLSLFTAGAVLPDGTAGCGPRQGHDFVRAVPHLPVQPLKILRAQFPFPNAAKVLQRQTGDVSLAPHRQLAVPVFSDDKGVEKEPAALLQARLVLFIVRTIGVNIHLAAALNEELTHLLAETGLRL